MSAIFWLIDTLLTIAFWVIIIQVILSWLLNFGVVDGRNPFVRQLYYGLEKLTAPIYRPLRRLLPDLGGIDLAPLIVCIGILFLQRLIMVDIQLALLGAR